MLLRTILNCACRLGLGAWRLKLVAWSLMLGARRFAAPLELVAWGPDQDARLLLPSKLRR